MPETEIIEDAEEVETAEIVLAAPASTEAMVHQLGQNMDAIKQVMSEVMKEDIDYGVIPGIGSKKPTLFQPGSEILFRLFRYSFQIEILDQVEDWDAPLFRYQIKGIARDESGRIIAEGLGEANSKESRYRRYYCPECESGVWDNRKDNRGGPPFVCKSTCGWTATKPSEVPTEFDFSLVNTIMKMATKRAKVATALTGTGASHFFTQDVEDLGTDHGPQRQPVDAPASADDPHCPACLAVGGELVAVNKFDKKPFWRCSRRGDECSAPREYKGKTYSWSGWHDSWEKSAQEWLDDNGHAGPREAEIGERAKSNWGFVLSEIEGVLGLTKTDAKALAKTALVYVIAEERFDPDPALGEPIADSLELSDDQLAAIAVNLDGAEAQIVVAGATELGDPT